VTLEYGLIAIPLMMLSLGILEFARLSWTREALQAVAADSARCMGVLQTACASAGAYSATNSATFVQQLAASWVITLPASAVTLNRAASCAGVSGFSQVTITYNFQTVLPLLLTSMADGIAITAQACFPNQQ
jgi:Flp pilus assembly protein TadG